MSAPRASSTRHRQRLAALLGVALAAALALAGAAWPPRPAAAEDGPAITVCPSCPTRTIAEALSRAEPGARIVVDGGRYPALTIDRPVALIGLHRPVIDAGGHGTALGVTEPDVPVQGFA
ncbi:MAG: hypothetical protein IRY97_11725, partial [Thermomicrobiaceae bacterium]|nr:hypothetical protein [Thermomicrobiaceae bacterium]